MRTKVAFLFIISLVFMFFSCSEVKKQVAIDDLVGTYSGTPYVLIEWSKLNIGLDDQEVDDQGSEFLVIGKDSQDNLFLKFDDGMKVKLTNIQMAINGAVFNIPQQNISMTSEGVTMQGNIAGLNENMFGESKCDGFYDSENNKLSFSFSGILNVNEQGLEYEVPIAVGYYEFIKQNL